MAQIRPLPHSVAVRHGEVGDWHTAIAIRSMDDRPVEYVTLCGTPVEFDNTKQRDRQGIGFDGRGFGCGACGEAELRRQ